MWGPCSLINLAMLALPRRSQKLHAMSTLARCWATSPSRIEPPAGNSARRSSPAFRGAMALAMIYPEPAKGGKGSIKNLDRSISTLLTQARTILRHSIELAQDVLTRGQLARCCATSPSRIEPPAGIQRCLSRHASSTRIACANSGLHGNHRRAALTSLDLMMDRLTFSAHGDAMTSLGRRRSTARRERANTGQTRWRNRARTSPSLWCGRISLANSTRPLRSRRTNSSNSAFASWVHRGHIVR
jgi:hypothetical protein